MDEISIFIVSCIFIVLLLSGIAGIGYMIEDRPVICTIDNKVIFKGRSACINIESSRAAIKVYTSRGLLCMIPDRDYVSNNVKLFNKGDK